MNSFFIYRSSAGSGKTYQLAVEFVSMAVANPNLFNKILAVTFTNKATKEMKERILSFLLKLANREDPELLKRIVENTGLSSDVIAENAAIVNDKILHNYSQFSISTIDAFFQKIVKSFAKELGLLGNYKVELDQDSIMQEIIDQIIDDLGKEKELTNWLVDFSFSKVDENKAWNIRPQIESLAYEVFKESFREVEGNLTQGKQVPFKQLLGQVREVKKEFEQFMIDQSKQAHKQIEDSGLVVEDFAYGKSGPAGYFARIINKKEFDPKERVRSAIEDSNKWSTKTSTKKESINAVVASGLQQLTIELVAYYDMRHIAYNTSLEIERNLYVFGILSRILSKLKNYRQEHDVMLISDVPIFLNKIIADNETPFIYEKTGTWYRHYLIDEFQDTSGHQWQNFKPLVESSLSENQRSLLVGDGKQSIYRWRGGDWSLILNKVKEDLNIYQPVEKHLDTNWRSDRKIIQFNNEVFSHLSSLISTEFTGEIETLTLPEEEKKDLSLMSMDVKKLYNDVIQKVAFKNQEPSKGFIEVNAFNKNEGLNWKEHVLDELPKQVERLQDIGFSASDITILVRRSEEGKQVIERLLRYKNSIDGQPDYCYDAISNESLFLGNSSAIRLIIDTIKFGLNPEDAIARAEITFNYRQVVERVKSNFDDLSFITNEEFLPANFHSEVQTLISLPVYEMIEWIIQFFHLTDPSYKGYLQAFQDIVLDYFANESKDLNDFLKWWEEKGKRKSIQLPEHINAIKVMTIHKSKGLEFKALIIPFCDWKLDHDATKNNILWCQTEQEPFNNAGFLPVKYGKALAESYFAKAYYQEKIRAYIDNLNLLYVALTRAENQLIINCPPASKSLTNVGDLMLNAIEKIGNLSSETLSLQVISDNDLITRYVIGDREKEILTEKAPTIPDDKYEYRTSDWRQKIAIRKKGNTYFESETPEWKAKINYGLLVHEILAGIRNEKEADDFVEQYYMEGQISSEDKVILLDQLNKIFSNPLVKEWFNTDFEVKTEIPIITRFDQYKRPDRVLINDTQAVIIDFKTGISKPADTKQVLDYQAILKEMGYEDVTGYLLYIAQNKVVKVA